MGLRSVFCQRRNGGFKMSTSPFFDHGSAMRREWEEKTRRHFRHSGCPRRGHAPPGTGARRRARRSGRPAPGAPDGAREDSDRYGPGHAAVAPAHGRTAGFGHAHIRATPTAGGHRPRGTRRAAFSSGTPGVPKAAEGRRDTGGPRRGRKACPRDGSGGSQAGGSSHESRATAPIAPLERPRTGPAYTAPHPNARRSGAFRCSPSRSAAQPRRRSSRRAISSSTGVGSVVSKSSSLAQVGVTRIRTMLS